MWLFLLLFFFKLDCPWSLHASFMLDIANSLVGLVQSLAGLKLHEHE